MLAVQSRRKCSLARGRVSATRLRRSTTGTVWSMTRSSHVPGARGRGWLEDMSRPLLLGAALSALLTSVIAVSAAPAQAVIGPLVIVGVFPSSPAASTSPTFYGTTGVGAV